MANEKLDKPNIIQIAMILVKLHLTSTVFDSTEINNCCGESNISSVCFQISSQLFVVRAEWLQCQLITGPLSSPNQHVVVFLLTIGQYTYIVY